MTITLQSLVGGIVKAKPRDLSVVRELMAEEREEYSISEVVSAIDAKDIVIIALTGRDQYSKVKEDNVSLDTASKVIGDLVRSGYNGKVTITEGKQVIVKEQDGLTVNLVVDGMENKDIFLAGISFLVTGKEIKLHRCQCLPTSIELRLQECMPESQS